MPATMVRGCGFADIHLHVHQLVGALDALGGEHQAHAQIHLDEIVDGDFGVRRRGAAAPASCPSAPACSAVTFSSSSRILPTASFSSMRGKTPDDFADLLAGLQAAPRERVEAHGFDGLRHAELRPDLAGDSRQHGREQRGDDAQRFGGGVQRGVEPLLRLRRRRCAPVSTAPAAR